MNTQNQNRSSELAADALKTLIEALEAGNSEALKSYLAVMARFNQYSWNNCLLIALQRPGATHVAGSTLGTNWAGSFAKVKRALPFLPQ